MQEWNRQRTLAIERSLTQFLYPQMAKELKNKLIAEAKENIIKVDNVTANLATSRTHHNVSHRTVS